MNWWSWKVKPGIYVTLNPARTDVFRVSKYEEDGSLSVHVKGIEREVRGWHWRIEKLCAAPPEFVLFNDAGNITGVSELIALSGEDLFATGYDKDDFAWSEIGDMFATKAAALSWVAGLK